MPHLYSISDTVAIKKRRSSPSIIFQSWPLGLNRHECELARSLRFGMGHANDLDIIGAHVALDGGRPVVLDGGRPVVRFGAGGES